MKRTTFTYLFLLISLFLILTGCSNDNNAEESTNPDKFPEKEVKIVVPAEEGGTVDLAARALEKPFKDITGQPLVVENEVGGGGTVGTQSLSEENSDGYHVGLLQNGVMSLRPYVSEVDYEYPENFTPILGIGTFQTIIVGSAGSSYDNVVDMAEDYKKEGKTIKIGAAQSNNWPEVTSALFSKKTGADVNYVSFENANEAALGVESKSVDIAITNVGESKSLVENDDLKVIGVPAEDRYDVYDDIPTLEEQGLDIDIDPGFSIYAPGDMPDEIQMKLNEIFSEAMDSEEFQDFLKKQDIRTQKMDPDEVTNNIEKEINIIDSLSSELSDEE